VFAVKHAERQQRRRERQELAHETALAVLEHIATDAETLAEARWLALEALRLTR
jgi:hypothetical protein